MEEAKEGSTHFMIFAKRLALLGGSSDPLSAAQHRNGAFCLRCPPNRLIALCFDAHREAVRVRARNPRDAGCKRPAPIVVIVQVLASDQNGGANRHWAVFWNFDRIF